MVRDPDEAGRRLLVTVKSNLAVEAPSWGRCLLACPGSASPEESDDGPDPRSASELLVGAPSSALSDAVNWLTGWRSEHTGPVPAAELLAVAAKAGIASTTLHRARK